MFLSKLFNHRHTQKFAPGASKSQREEQVLEIQRMMKSAGIEATIHVTENEIEFGFLDERQADDFRYNMVAMYGDFGPMRHTQNFNHPDEQQSYGDFAVEAAEHLGISLDMIEHEGKTILNFQTSEDALIMKRVMEISSNNPLSDAIIVGESMQNRLQNHRNRNLG